MSITCKEDYSLPEGFEQKTMEEKKTWPPFCIYHGAIILFPCESFENRIRLLPRLPDKNQKI